MNIRCIQLVMTILSAVFASASFAQTAEIIRDGVYRFDASEDARLHRRPSISMVRQLESSGEFDTENYSLVPTFTQNEEGRYVASINIESSTSLYGTGQVAGPLLRNGFVTETWNYDAFGYGLDAQNLYTSQPWVLAVREDGSAFGVLADTTERCEIDLRNGITFRGVGYQFPIVIIESDSPSDVMKELAELTGKIAMPPRWAIGFHQCRYSYNPDSRVKEVADEFRKRSLPADVIWMDIDYMNEYRVFTFDPEEFPDPTELNDYLDKVGFSNVWMIDPGVKAEEGYFVYDSGTELNVWTSTVDGAVFKGEVWPGVCVFPDYLNKDVRTWWSGLYKDFMAYNIDGVWNDMNEPAVFNVESKTMPEDNIHHADPELGGTGSHARYHNVYGMQMIRATREGVVAANPNKRPFVLSRANHLGGQRYGATWTGDNSATWEHLDMSIPMTINLGLSGQPFAGPDIGGFAYNGDGELYARWMGFGTLFPFARSHTAKGNIDKEPWSYTPEVEATSRRALERRYRLMPYIYTLFHESSTTGAPIAMPTFFADPNDFALRSEDDSFLLGDHLLVSAKVSPESDRVSVLPKSINGVEWAKFDFESYDGGRDSKDSDLPDLYIRPGSIIVTCPVTQYFGDRPDQRDEITLIVHLDANGEATGTLYEDAGDGLEYLEGEYLLSTFKAVRDGDSVTVKIDSQSGNMAQIDRKIQVRVVGN
ncbi:MAG: glycoside hydrolase family 31 protein [Phycisphaerales bacterium]|nr:glycoside hydrolase family 31 protein [Phycisphaerales bacterium]